MITILIPATRPIKIRDTLNSLVSQVYKDMRILVADNTFDGLVIEKNHDAYPQLNIEWIHSYHQTEGDSYRNSVVLSQHIDSPYFKFLFDDDILSPLSIAQLILHLQQGVQHVFHSRMRYDDGGNVFYPESLFKPNHQVKISKIGMLNVFAKTCTNFIGEHSFCATNSSALDLVMMHSLGGLPVRFLTDVAMHINVADIGPVMGIGAPLGFYHVSPNQQSSLSSAVRVYGIIEWELVARYAFESGALSSKDIDTTRESLSSLYKHNETMYPKLKGRAEFIRTSNLSLDSEFREFFFSVSEVNS